LFEDLVDKRMPQLFIKVFNGGTKVIDINPLDTTPSQLRSAIKTTLNMNIPKCQMRLLYDYSTPSLTSSYDTREIPSGGMLPISELGIRDGCTIIMMGSAVGHSCAKCDLFLMVENDNNSERVERYLNTTKINLNEQRKHVFPSSILGRAVQNRCVKIIKILLERGAKPNDYQLTNHIMRETPLQLLCATVQRVPTNVEKQIIKILIEHGADIFSQGPRGSAVTLSQANIHHNNFSLYLNEIYTSCFLYRPELKRRYEEDDVMDDIVEPDRKRIKMTADSENITEVLKDEEYLKGLMEELIKR
jgi:hypothetical protein